MQSVQGDVPSAAPLIMDRVGLRRGRRDVLAGVSLAVPAGRFLSILGGPGAGKSALIALLAGTASAAGTIAHGGLDLTRVAAHRRGFGVATQHDALFPQLTLAQNVAYPLVLRRIPRRDRRRLVDAALESVLLEDGGRRADRAGLADRQRAWIARATVFGPRVLLLDEPLSHQPQETRLLLVAALRRLHCLLGVTTVMATRVAGDAMALSDQVAVLDQGRLIQAGPPSQLYEQPNSAIAALACGEANLLPGVVHAIDEEGVARVGLTCGPTVEGTAATTLRVRDNCLFCLRPERIAVAPTIASEMGEDALDATVLEVLHLGDAVRLRLLLGSGQEVLVKRPAAAGLRGLKPGEGVAIAWQPQHANVFGMPA